MSGGTSDCAISRDATQRKKSQNMSNMNEAHIRLNGYQANGKYCLCDRDVIIKLRKYSTLKVMAPQLVMSNALKTK